MNDIKKQLYYEDLFNNQGTIIEEQIDVEDAKKIIKYNVANVIDYLLRYPLGISLLEYIIDNNLLKQDCDICKICLMLDFDTVLDDFFSTKTKVKKFID